MSYLRLSLPLSLAVTLAIMVYTHQISSGDANGDNILFNGLLAGVACFLLLNLRGHSRRTTILFCWGASLCLYLLFMNLEIDIRGENEYMSSLWGMLMPLILPPILLLEAVAIWLLSSLRQEERKASALHQSFLDAVEEGDEAQVANLLPHIYPDHPNDRGENALQQAVLAATDTIHPPRGNPMAVVRLLLPKSSVEGCIDAIVDQHELYFEATDPQSDIYQNAVTRTTELIPLLAAAGDTISSAALDSARYNCDPSIQRVLAQVKLKPAVLPEE